MSNEIKKPHSLIHKTVTELTWISAYDTLTVVPSMGILNMANGADQEECEAVESAYKLIGPDLENFARVHDLDYVPWRWDEPVFLIEWPKGRTLGYTGIAKNVQVYLDYAPDGVSVRVHAVSFSDNGPRRIKSTIVAEGTLPKDKERILRWLECAWAICSATIDPDLLPVDEWQEKNKKLLPIFDQPLPVSNSPV